MTPICCTAGYRMLLLRGSKDDRPSQSLSHEVEHEALLMLLADAIGRDVSRDGGTDLPARRLDGARRWNTSTAAPRRPRARRHRRQHCSTPSGSESMTLHRARIAHRSLHAGNILVDAGSPVIVDFSFAEESADERRLAIDRAELAHRWPPSPDRSRSSRRPNAPSDPTTWRPRCPTCSRWRCPPPPGHRCRSRCSKSSATASPRPRAKRPSRWNG